jgi:hypothetical protein
MVTSPNENADKYYELALLTGLITRPFCAAKKIAMGFLHPRKKYLRPSASYIDNIWLACSSHFHHTSNTLSHTSQSPSSLRLIDPAFATHDQLQLSPPTHQRTKHVFQQQLPWQQPDRPRPAQSQQAGLLQSTPKRTTLTAESHTLPQYPIYPPNHECRLGFCSCYGPLTKAHRETRRGARIGSPGYQRSPCAGQPCCS